MNRPSHSVSTPVDSVVTNRFEHVPQLAQRTDGRWGVFCAACSHDAGDYIYACPAAEKEGWPPPILREAEASDEPLRRGVEHLATLLDKP